jgi:hypothetical protein
MAEAGSREIFNLVLLVATLPALAFVIWLSWLIVNRLMSPEWQQKRRSRQIRKAVAERQALMEQMTAAEKPAEPSPRPR